MPSASGARTPRRCSRALSPTEAWRARYGRPSRLRRPRAQLNPLGALAACLPQAHRRPAGFWVGAPIRASNLRFWDSPVQALAVDPEGARVMHGRHGLHQTWHFSCMTLTTTIPPTTSK